MRYWDVSHTPILYAQAERQNDYGLRVQLEVRPTPRRPALHGFLACPVALLPNLLTSCGHASARTCHVTRPRRMLPRTHHMRGHAGRLPAPFGCCRQSWAASVCFTTDDTLGVGPSLRLQWAQRSLCRVSWSGTVYPLMRRSFFPFFIQKGKKDVYYVRRTIFFFWRSTYNDFNGAFGQ